MAKSRQLVGRALLTVALAGTAMMSLGWALQPSLRSKAITPSAPLVSGMVTALVDVIRTLRAVSPYVAMAGVASLIGFALVGSFSPRVGVLNRLASIDYAGVDHLSPREAGRSRVAGRLRRWFGGTGLAILAIVLVGASSGIENEVTSGPLRPIDAVVGLVSKQPVTFVLQGPDITFMDDSTIPVDQMNAFAQMAPFSLVPFGKYLFNINNKSALEVSIPGSLFYKLTGDAAATCAAAGIIVDNTLGVHKGATVEVNGVPLKVVGVMSGIAQMNRSIAVMADATARDCVQAGTNTGYFGAMALTSNAAVVQQAITKAGLPGAHAVSEATFRENNRNFWRANATPLLLQIILYLTLFSGFAAAGERQSALQRNSREIGMLHAGGVDFRVLKFIEYRRALRTTLTAALVAAPILAPVAAAFNASELGVHIGVGFTELSVGTALTLVASLLAARRSLNQFKRSLDLSLAVKG